LSGGVVDLGGGRHGGQTATAVTSMAVHVVGKFTFVKIQFMVNKAQKLKQQATWLESSMRFINGLKFSKVTVTFPRKCQTIVVRILSSFLALLTLFFWFYFRQIFFYFHYIITFLLSSIFLDWRNKTLMAAPPIIVKHIAIVFQERYFKSITISKLG
jgi:hypothetical protein